MKPIVRINKKIIIASRNSNLAKTQTELVVSKLRYAGYKNIEKVFLKSKGDTISKTKFKKFGGKGLFTEEIDKLIIDNKVHLGVHSAKDIPAVLNKKLGIGAPMPSFLFNTAGISLAECTPK